MPPARPEGWSPRYVLERLEAGEKITRICAVAAKGLPVKWSTLYQEIRAWKKQSLAEDCPEELEGFHEQYEFWMEENARRFPGENRHVKRVGGGGKLPAGWWQLWLRTYLDCHCNSIETNRMMEEVYGIKVSMSTIIQMRNPTHALYNEAFTRQFDEAKPLRVEKNAAVIFDIIDDPNGDARTRSNAALQVNERLDKVGWGRSSHMIHSGQVNHSHRHEIASQMETFKELVADRFGGQKRIEAPPAELEVVDAEVVEVEAEAKG